MLRLYLYLIFCICLMLIVYIGFFKKDRVESRLEEIGKDTFDTLDMASPTKKREEKTLRLLRIPQSVKDDIAAAGILLRTEEFVMIWITLAFLPAMILFILGAGTVISIGVAVIMAMLPPVFVKFKKKRRMDQLK